MSNPEDFIPAYQSALGTQNWSNVQPLIHERACVTFSTGAVHIGKPEVKKAYEKNFSIIRNEEYKITNVHWVKKTTAMAVYLFDFHWSGIIAGQKASGSGRGTTVLIIEDGRWQLLTEHLGPAAS